MNIKVAIAQVKLVVGAFKSNYNKILDYWRQAEEANVDLIVFPELAVCGYNVKDLVLRQSFQNKCKEVLQSIVAVSINFNCALVVGNIYICNGKLYNSAYLLYKGNIVHRHDKIELPNYSVFNEKRVFSAANQVRCVSFKNYKIGLLICEDIWYPKHYKNLQQEGAELIIVINASPFHKAKCKQRINVIVPQVKKNCTKLIYVNQVGVQDNIVFDGRSMVFDKTGAMIYQAQAFEEELVIIDFTKEKYEQVIANSEKKGKKQIICINGEHNISYNLGNKLIIQGEESDLYSAMMVALKDYLSGCNFVDVIIGLSGGIDSALTVAIAIDAIGAEHVHLVTMPSRYTSSITYKDTAKYLKLIGKTAINIDIEPIFTSYINSLGFCFIDQSVDVTKENLQARVRGTLLMALSNKYNYLLLSTSNKSELAVGYATLYGDMNGGYNLLKDLYKTEIYELAVWRNNNFPRNGLGIKGHIIPDSILTREPTAELRYNQRDSDSLPRYHILDQILYLYIEQGRSSDEIIAQGYSSKVVNKVLKLVQISEFKRNQSVMGPKLSSMSFGDDWRYPIINKFWK